MAKQAYLKVEQTVHNAPSPTTPGKTLPFGCFRFCVPLYFDGLSKWLIGRSPDASVYPSTESIYSIYIPSVFITRNLAIVHATKSVYDDIHVIETLTDKQRFVDSMTGLSFVKKPLKDNESFQVENLPFFKFKYVVINDNEPSEDLSKSTVY